MKIIFAMVKRMIPAVATRGRLLSMAVVGAIGIAIGIVLRQAELEVADLDQYVASFGFTIFVPLVALVISTATLGSLREDKTLIYLWLRPIGRWMIAASAVIAGLIVLLPLTLIPMGVIGAISGEADSVLGALGGSMVGLISYLFVFTMLGLFTQRALAWGLLYVLVWEGVVAGFSQGAGQLAIRTYARAAMTHISGSEVIVDPPSGVTVVIVTVAVAVVTFAVTTWRLQTMTVD